MESGMCPLCNAKPATVWVLGNRKRGYYVLCEECVRKHEVCRCGGSLSEDLSNLLAMKTEQRTYRCGRCDNVVKQPSFEELLGLD